MTIHTDLPPPGGAQTSDRLARMTERWNTIRVRHIEIWPPADDRDDRVRIHAVIHLGELVPADVRVDARETESLDDEPWWQTADWPIRPTASHTYRNGSYVFEARLAQAGFDRMRAIAVRVMPPANLSAPNCRPVGQTFLLAGMR